ncbi:MAG: TrkH family potassium uptake protein [Bacteroidales bacterium]|jgi:trk system potassium uptake protein|nr:TrkH family potassium uptake protein [Bacteroidales bacterium]MDD4633319.1 TrkH family potassium uptake protein [Bacteroidales bacterium]
MSKNVKKLNYLLITKVIGLLILLEACLMFFALPFSLYYGSGKFGFETLFSTEHDLMAIALSVAITLFVGVLLYFASRKSDTRTFGKREGFIIVSVAWFVMALFGALPYMFSAVLPSFTDAFFEAVSGFTTTGLTTIPNVESAPPGILFWRSMTHWIGGMGIVFMSLALLPMALGNKGSLLFAAETSNDVHDKVHPRIKETAKRLWIIYVGFSVVCCFLLMLGKVDFFNSICITLSTISTGGFSVNSTSMAQYTPYIHYVIIIFMILGATSFNLHYLLLFKFQLRKILKNEEWRTYILIILTSTLFITGVIANDWNFASIEKNFRSALFHVVSIITTTGFTIEDFTLWSANAWAVVFAMSFICGCTGSTTGGIKVYRHIIMFKNCKMELQRQIHPQAVMPVRYNNVAVPQGSMNNVMAFFYLFVFIYGASSLLLMLFGLDFKTATGTAICCLANIGCGIGDIASPSGAMGNTIGVIKWILSFLMVIGRLELFTVMVIFNKSFWKR